MMHALLTEKPKVPQYPLVDIEKEQKSAIEGNISNLPIMEQLASSVNKFASDQIEQQMERAMPGYRQLVNKETANIASMSRGELPEDVSRLLQQRSAEAGVALGTSGSQHNKYDELRNLGLASLDITNRGLDAATRWIASAQTRSPTVDVTSMFVTPQQRISAKLQENANVFQRNWLAAKVKAIPSGGKAALITLFDNIEEIGSSVLKMYAGGAMGGAMGGGGGGGSSSAPPVGDAWQGMGAPTQSSGLQYQQTGGYKGMLDFGPSPGAATYQGGPSPAPYYNPGGAPAYQFPDTFG